MPGLRRLSIFVLKAFLVLLVFSSFWTFVAPGYAGVLARVSDVLAMPDIKLTATDTTINIRMVKGTASASIYTMPLQGGLLLLLSLILTTPGLGWVRRAKYVLLGGACCFVIHVVTVLVMSGEMLALDPLVVLFASVGIDFFPIAIWLVLSARYWWPGRGAVPAPVFNPDTATLPRDGAGDHVD